MRIKRKVIGGVAAVGVLIGAFLSGWIPGLGSGSGSGETTPGAVSVSADPTATPVQPAAPSTPKPPAGTAEQPAAKQTLETLDVYVDDRSYAIPLKSGGHKRVSTASVMRLAKATTGNSDGVRIRVLRTKDARYTTWSRLVDELENTLSIGSDAISIPEELVELPGEEVK